jgi:hypothetical protein
MKQANNLTISYGRERQKDVHALTSGEKGETVSVIACSNAEGNFLPPFLFSKA